MSKYVLNPRFFIYENKEVAEVTESEFHQWTNNNWHPSHMLHGAVKGSHDEVFLGFQGHYKFCEWQGKPFNVTYFVYGNDVSWLEVYDEYFATFEEAEIRYHQLIENGHISNIKELLQAA